MRMQVVFVGLVLVLGGAAGARAAEPDILTADFEGKDYGLWKVTGEAFGAGPASGPLRGQRPVSGFLGQGLVNSYLGGDKPQGTLTSPEFKIERKYVNLLVGGGGHEGKTCVNLLVGGKVVRSAAGLDDETLDWRTWDVAEFLGQVARIEIVDKESGGWGHVNVDHIVQGNERKDAAVAPEELYRETYRPQFHFTAQKNWLNDPNGLVFYKGEYHLFFQHNPKGIKWGNMTWGHAVSPDLVHWTQLAHAIDPDNLGTIFSGSAVVDFGNTAGFQKGDEKTLVCIYTSAGKPFTQSIAYSTDRGRTFAKYEKNPVLGHIIGNNRDPKVVWHAPTKQWIMTLFKDKNQYGFFSSPDLKAWTHLHDITVPGCGECPDFFEMPVDGNKQKTMWVWTAANGQYLVGTFDGKKFTPESGPHRVDWGGNFYAVQTFSDIPESDGRRIQITWMRGGQYPRMPFNQQMSFPCVLTLKTLPEGIRMCRMPVKEIETLYAREHKWEGAALGAGENPLSGLSGDLFDVCAELELGDAAEVGLKVRGEAIAYNVKDRKLSCLGKSAALEPAPGNRLALRVLVDRTSLEVFGNDGRVSMTSCFLPKAEERSLEVYAAGGAARIVSLKVYELRSAWPAAKRP